MRACLTDAASQFVTPALFEALTGEPCLTDVFDEPERGRMAHIEWARQADVIAIAPATANLVSKLAHGVADDMLTTLVVAFSGPVVVAPAMNPTMLASESVQSALTTLAERGTFIVNPETGEVACGESGQGKFATNAAIADAVDEAAYRSNRLQGKKVLITSGPTVEPLDDVRFLSNRSSGKMGAALATAALMMGADVTVVCGPQQASIHPMAKVVRVETAEEMLAASLQFVDADLIVGAAAVADYRPNKRVPGKMRRGGAMTLELIPNPDVVAELAKRAKGMVVAFAAEPGSDLEIARTKMARKRVHAIAANDYSAPGLGFSSGKNRLTLLRVEKPPVNSGVRSKLGCALWLYETLFENGG